MLSRTNYKHVTLLNEPGLSDLQESLGRADSAPPHISTRRRNTRDKDSVPNNSDGTAKMKTMAYIDGLRKFGYTDEQIRTMLGLKDD